MTGSRAKSKRRTQRSTSRKKTHFAIDQEEKKAQPEPVKKLTAEEERQLKQQKM